MPVATPVVLAKVNTLPFAAVSALVAIATLRLTVPCS
jgi:hypothetical protein